jgi:hypothetical protein
MSPTHIIHRLVDRPQESRGARPIRYALRWDCDVMDVGIDLIQTTSILNVKTLRDDPTVHVSGESAKIKPPKQRPSFLKSWTAGR